MSADARPSARTNTVPTLALVALAPAAWFTHLAVNYALVPWSCRAGTDLPLHVVTVLALVGLATSGGLAARRSRDGASVGVWLRVLMSSDAQAPGRPSLPLVALVFAAYFALVVAMAGLVPIVVDRCA